MSVDLETARKWMKDCDPNAALEYDDPRYVPLDEGTPVRGRQDESCVARLFDTIQLASPTSRTCQLFTGFWGAGKSTELKRLKHRLETDTATGTKTFVLYIPTMDFVDMYAPPAVSDVLGVFAHCLESAATEAEGGDPEAKPRFLRRMYEFLESDVQLREIGFEGYGASLLLEIKDNPAFRSRVRAQLALRFGPAQ